MSDVPIIHEIDEDIATPHTKRRYPFIRLLDANDALALIVPSLPPGELPIVMTYKGSTRQLGTVEKSALALCKLLPITRIEYVRASDDSTLLTTNMDMLEMPRW